MKEAVWFPDEKVKKTRLYRWMNQLGFGDYDDFFEKSIADIQWFWSEAEQLLDLKWHRKYESALTIEEDWMYPQWFRNGQMNIVTNVLGKWASHPETAGNTALIWEGDQEQNHCRFSFAELQKEVNRAAAAFKGIGMEKGDIATIYMPMIPETVISMLALAKIGCIFSPVFSGYGAEAVATRIDAAKSKYLITAQSYYRRGKKINMMQEAGKAAAACASIQRVIIANCDQDSQLDPERDIPWHSFPQTFTKVETEQMDSNDPLMILYTSGTTGKPKGAVHTHTGFPVKAALDAALCMDVTKGDTLFWYSDMGWMMGPFMVFGGLVNGAAILLFEGVPDYPSHDRLWKICDQQHVTQLGISPTLVRSLMTHGPEAIQHHNLTRLKAIGSTGEPWNPDPWMWLFTHVCKRKIPIINYSGGTEISGGILGNVMLKPITPITFNSPLPGMDVDVYSPEAQPVVDEVGELVIKQPWVGMTAGFWKENDRFEQAYWNVFPKTWVHGDWVIRDGQGYWTITGRSDDILNVAGKRLGPAEMESILVEHPNVIESACIGVPHEIKGETALCFAVVNHPVPLDSLKEELEKAVAYSLGKALKPSQIHFVDQLPKTRNGKVMRRMIKAAYLHQPTGDLSALDNPDSLRAIAALNADMSHSE
ncbi:AMP-binding protein [Bacillus sp. 1P06AnD]|uniref:AMP-binding protein n=1 Tax=Bacillus sp. 1P06AnD TaxID=3132208 RepID=UPI0039A355D2